MDTNINTDINEVQESQVKSVERIYLVTDTKGVKNLVKARSSTHAVQKVSKLEYDVRVPSTTEVVDLLQSGIVVLS